MKEALEARLKLLERLNSQAQEQLETHLANVTGLVAGHIKNLTGAHFVDFNIGMDAIMSQGLQPSHMRLVGSTRAASQFDCNIADLMVGYRQRCQPVIQTMAEYGAEIQYLEKGQRLVNAEPEIGRSTFRLVHNRQFFSYWFGGSPVFYREGGDLVLAFATRKNDHLELKSVPERQISYYPKKFAWAENIWGLDGKFFNADGFPIPDQHVEAIQDRFDRIRNGERFMLNDSGTGIRAKRKKREEDAEPGPAIYQPRHWGQEYLQSLGPDEIIEGAVTADGNAYTAFRFGNRVVLESDTTNRSSLFFTAKSFDRLKGEKPNTLHANNPRGYLGRHFHRNEDGWKANVRDKLGISE